MNGLLYAVQCSVFFVFSFQITATYRNFVLEFTHYAPWVLLPVTGWVAESWLGRHRAIVIWCDYFNQAIIIIMTTVYIILTQVAFMTLHSFDLV